MNQIQVLVVKNKAHKKVLVSAIKALLEYHEATGKVEGSLRRIADTLNKAHSTMKRYLWELRQQGLVEYDGKKYWFSPDKLREALKALGATQVPARKHGLLELIGDEARVAQELEKIRSEVSKVKTRISEIEKTIKAMKTMKKEKKCKNEELLRELDEWSKSMDEWADNVDKRLEDLEQRVSRLANLVLKLLEEVREK